MSEDVLEQTIDQAVEEALYEARLAAALSESRKDFEEGRFYSSRKDMMEAVNKKRKLHSNQKADIKQESFESKETSVE